jgi:N-acetylglucosaminyl-diphospho-decaprenol L-rhamnosyltransferase
MSQAKHRKRRASAPLSCPEAANRAVADGWIHIVVPVHNRKNFTHRFLACVRPQRFRNRTVIVVDDGSSDGTSELIKEKYSDVQLLRGDGTLWWTGAINLGIKRALAQCSPNDAVLVINEDLEIDPVYLGSLYRLWQSMPKTLIGSALVDISHPEVIVDGSRRVNWWTAKFRILNCGKKLTDFNENHYEDVSLLTGWGTLIPVQGFHEIGLYDDKHFQQSGDTELPVRMRNVGYRLIVSYACVAKTWIDATASVNITERYLLRDLKRYLFDVKSNYRLRYRYFFAYDTARNPFAFVTFLSLDLLRVLAHFLRRAKSSERRADNRAPPK